MPQYAEPFGRYLGAAGGTAGAAGGGGLLGTLGRLLEPLDYPRQALYNAVRAGGNALSGEGTWEDALRAVPGALGGALAGGLMATGVGAPLGILAGSALGGVAQGIGHATGREEFQAPGVEELTGTDELLPNLLVGALTDPLTYAGAIGGGHRGAAAGRRLGQGLGRSLEEAALARGPRYAGGAEKLDNILREAAEYGMPHHRFLDLQAHLEHARANPAILSEIPPGSTYVGHGREALVLRRPDGGVVTISRHNPSMNEILEANRMPLGDPLVPPPTRVDIPEMLPAVRSRGIEGPGAARIEHVPFADITSPERLPGETIEQYRARWADRGAQANAMRIELRNRGVNFWDAHGGNVGYDAAGNLRITDPGAVEGTAILRGPEREFIRDAEGNLVNVDLPRAPEVGRQQPGRIQSLLLRLLGSDESVQRELTQQLLAQNAPGGLRGGAAPLTAAEAALPRTAPRGVSPPAPSGTGAAGAAEAALARTPSGRPSEMAVQELLSRLRRGDTEAWAQPGIDEFLRANLGSAERQSLLSRFLGGEEARFRGLMGTPGDYLSPFAGSVTERNAQLEYLRDRLWRHPRDPQSVVSREASVNEMLRGPLPEGVREELLGNLERYAPREPASFAPTPSEQAARKAYREATPSRRRELNFQDLMDRANAAPGGPTSAEDRIMQLRYLLGEETDPLRRVMLEREIAQQNAWFDYLGASGPYPGARSNPTVDLLFPRTQPGPGLVPTIDALNFPRTLQTLR
jgi:hypothetical protein